MLAVLAGCLATTGCSALLGCPATSPVAHATVAVPARLHAAQLTLRLCQRLCHDEGAPVRDGRATVVNGGVRSPAYHEGAAAATVTLRAADGRTLRAVRGTVTVHAGRTGTGSCTQYTYSARMAVHPDGTVRDR